MPDNPSPAPTKDVFHLERSLFLDSFAALEEAERRAQPHQLDDALARRVKELRRIRNDIVHTQLKFVQMSGELHALAINSSQTTEPMPLARIIRLDDLRKLRDELGRLGTKLSAA